MIKMSTKFTEYKGLNLPTVASEVLEFWKKENIFEQSVTTREGNPAFVFFEGPPSANGLPGIHHVMARAIKDIFCRYKTQKGFQVKRKAGWDTHGLPVELGTEAALGITKEDIGTKISIEEYNEACKKTVMRYTDVWNDLTEKMGYWVDMNDPYITYKPKYMESVWWLLQQIYNKNLMYKGYTIQPYSPKAGTGLSSHEVNQPGSYRDVTDTTVVAQFKASPTPTLPEGEGVENSISKAFRLASLPFGENWGGAFFLAWTTTPWTLPSNTALTVGPKIDYVLVRTFNQYTFLPTNVILAKNLVGKQFGKGFFEPNEDIDFENYAAVPPTGSKGLIPYKILAECKGADLVGIRYEQLLNYALPYLNPENAFRVIAGDFVTTEDGTGIVHTAPTFGADDAKAAKEATPEVPPLLVLDENGNPVPLVDLQGKFRPEMKEFAGKYVKNEYYNDGEAPEKSIDVELAIKLKEENKAFKVEKYVHSYPHCWRTDKPILYYPLDSWFIKITEVRDRMFDLNETINWKPKATGEGRFGNWLKNANDWNLSRSRYWGIPLPIWRTEDGTEEMIIGSVAELYNEIEKSISAGFQKENPFAGFEIGNLTDENYDLIDLHKNVVDQITLVSASGKPMVRETDLIDVWFDSGAMPYAQWHYPFSPPPAPPKGRGAETPTLNKENQFQSDNHSVTTPSPLGSDGVGLGHKYETARASIYPLLKELKDKNKTNPTEAEKVLWMHLKGKKLEDFKFRRQHIIDQFIADFVCLDRKLIVEVDGGYHLKPEIIEADALRTEILENEFGYKVIRFTNDEVLGNIEGVLEEILKELNKLPSFKLTNSNNNNQFQSEATPSPWGRDGEGLVADFIAEGVDQTRGWFYTLHAISSLVFDRVAFKNVVSNGLVLDKEGKKMSKRLGNAPDPFEVLNKYGADATRWYMISNANPWDNLKFDVEGIAEVQRKFFGTLYNTYSFFALYANIDNFNYAEAEIPLNERPEIDRWILSELHTLIKNVDEAFADYEPTKAARWMSEFVSENLSNWYVRLCRRRFWKGEYAQDKIAAYQTLYTCLLTISKLGAPIAPFFMDKLYKDLTKNAQTEKFASVHLDFFPKFVNTFVDKSLESRMQKAQTISSLVLSLRKKEMIKVRQPLQKIMIPVLSDSFRTEIEAVADLIKAEVNVKEIQLLDDASGILVKQIKPNFKTLGPRFGKDMNLIAKEITGFSQEQINQLEKESTINIVVNGNNVILTPQEVEISSQDIEGWLVANANGITVALDITITEALKNEGIARELVNRIQNIRKDSDFQVTDKITVILEKNDILEKAVNANLDYIKSETLTEKLSFAAVVEGLEIEFDEVKTRIMITK
jgi:isoleucyl-tRNA synthetase